MMKNNTAKLIPTRSYHASPRLTHDFKRKLERNVKLLFVNKELIEFIEKTLKKLPQKDKLDCLHYFKKLALQVHRVPDPDHYKAFEDLYLEEMSKIADEQKFYNPIKWIIAEIEYLQAKIGALEADSPQQNEQIASEKMFDEELVPEKMVIKILGMSKSKLLRLRAEGLPSQKIGKPIFYDLKKVKEWLKTEAA